ncbi:formate/nitrite transporter family protein [Haladaptatus salinisoli]|uniref:formate/nitrite transporter family protein n=1 Tax=Haladaptatus salinisoli TaxID=2884876 RepID=UPI001D0B8AE6|nr:formate/nitrite transporter family protein [Haladaptatus salinisoli]
MAEQRGLHDDRERGDQPAPDDQKPRQTILAQEIESGLNELERPADGLLLSGLSAGLDIGFGPLFMAVLTTLVATSWGEPLTEIVVANAYAVGFIFVILGRSELFTEHTTLAVLPVLDGQASIRQLSRLWGLVYLGNVVGGGVFAAVAVSLAPAYGIAESGAFVDIAKNLLNHGAPLLLVGGVLAGWLMGLLSWLVTAARETMARVFFVWLIATTIGLAHLPHSIAGNVEVLAGMLLSPSITALDYARFLVLATVGNAIGGSTFVALLKYGHVVRGSE